MVRRVAPSIAALGCVVAVALLAITAAADTQQMWVPSGVTNSRASSLPGSFRVEVSAESGGPLAGTRVRLYKTTGETAASLITDQRGEAATTLERGTYRVIAVKSGYLVKYGVTTIGAPYGCGPGSRCSSGVGTDTLLVVLAPGITAFDNQAWSCGANVNPFETASVYVTCNGP